MKRTLESVKICFSKVKKETAKLTPNERRAQTLTSYI